MQGVLPIDQGNTYPDPVTTPENDCKRKCMHDSDSAEEKSIQPRQIARITPNALTLTDAHAQPAAALEPTEREQPNLSPIVLPAAEHEAGEGSPTGPSTAGRVRESGEVGSGAVFSSAKPLSPGVASKTESMHGKGNDEKGARDISVLHEPHELTHCVTVNHTHVDVHANLPYPTHAPHGHTQFPN